jgi:guanylate kinase
MPTTGCLLIVSAPSGAGKSSLLREILAQDERLCVSVSHTTRAMRPGEQNGVHYHFVDAPTFQQLVADGVFLEHAQVFDNYYGTSEQALREQLAEGKDVVVEIDWQGARQVRKRFADAVSIFIAPPSIEALRERLGSRGQDSEEIIGRRMADARSEMSHYDEYDYLVINDNFQQAQKDLLNIVAAQRLRLVYQQQAQTGLLGEMLGGH